ncbi:MAG: aminotransferase class IV [Simkaniaceae bacterium]|nr:aminotransferase class IV [Simkaniaceae bacterium]
MENNVHFIDGEYVEESRATLPISDLSLHRGFGIFEYLRTYSGRPFHLREHLQRFRNSAKEMHLNVPYSDDEIHEILDTLLQKNGFEESAIKLFLTGGNSDDYLLPCSREKFLIFAKPYVVPKLPEAVSLQTITYARYMPEVKAIGYIPAVTALQRFKDADDILYVSESNEVLECTRSNLFAVKNGKLLTPKHGVLKGITRALVMHLCKTEECILTREALMECEEVFITSSTKEVLPVRQIDGHTFQAPGPITIELATRFTEYVKRGLQDNLNWSK